MPSYFKLVILTGYPLCHCAVDSSNWLQIYGVKTPIWTPKFLFEMAVFEESGLGIHVRRDTSLADLSPCYALTPKVNPTQV